MNYVNEDNKLFSYYYPFIDPTPDKFTANPKYLCCDHFKDLPVIAKYLYGFMHDRLSLSIKNKWYDEQSHVYIIFTIEETMELLNCSKTTAIKAHKCLEQYGLIQKEKSKGTRPDKIYVKMYLGN